LAAARRRAFRAAHRYEIQRCGQAYRAALALDPPPAEREFLASRLSELRRGA
jgi:hypothetical protein